MAFLRRFARGSLPVTLLALCGALGGADAASADYDFVTKWGSSGTGDSQFQFPAGIATDTAGNVYVSDLGDGSAENDQIRKFASSGEFLVRWGSEGSGDPRLFNPWGLAVDSADFVYVADTANHYVKKFSSSGVFSTKIGAPGSGDGEFTGPWGVAVDSSGNVYATDFNFGETVNRVQKFKPSIGPPYVFDGKWGVTGSEPGKFRQPYDIAADTAGNVYVCDNRNNRIQKFDSEGFFLGEWGGTGSGDGQFVFPEGIATDPDGNVYVADTGNNRIQKFTSTGAFVTKWGSHGTADGQFREPSDVAADDDGNVYVVDTTNDRIQKFSETGGSSGSGGTGGAGGAAGGGGAGKGAPIVDVSSKFKLKSTTVLSRSGRLKFILDLPAPGVVEMTATIKAPPRPPSLDPDQRQHEGHKSTVSKAKKRKPIVVATARATASAAGPLTLTLAPNGLGKKYLGWKQALPVTVTIVYTPTGGTAKSVTLHTKLKLAKKKPRPRSRR
jgi:DNA-binding beta-propeller fold protein YncE